MVFIESNLLVQVKRRLARAYLSATQLGKPARRSAPPGGPPAVALNAEEKALLHHFRRLPSRLRRQLTHVFRSLGGLASESGGLPEKRPLGGAD